MSTLSTWPQRPDPDELLKQIGDSAKKAARGKLKIFFGSCPGVGKTYAMLLAGHERKREGLDVVIGVIETHGRIETRKLLDGLPPLPTLTVTHRGIDLQEFDLDAAKALKPGLILVDELAHTNAPGTRHAKRWNDIEELLAAGINVYTTLNVQHIESLSDVVAGTTGVWVKETIPDAVFDTADDVVLVDLDVDELRKRLREGKVYVSSDARARALDNFFTQTNLTALREIALRRTAERVDAQLQDYTPMDKNETYPVAERIMVCIGPDPLSAKLVRTAKRMASSLKAPWTAVYIENLRHYRLTPRSRQAVQSFARMAERIGGKSVILQGENVVDEIINYARANRITKIIIGKPITTQWRTILFGSLADKIIRNSEHIDVYVITGHKGDEPIALGKDNSHVFRPWFYIEACLTAAALTLLGVAIGSIATATDQALIYLTGVVFVASRLGRGPSFIYTLLSVSCLNFFFIPPIYSFEVYDRSFWLTFIVMMATSYVITNQASRLRLQTRFARERERETQTFYALTKDLASTRGSIDIAKTSARHIDDMVGVHVGIWLLDAAGTLAVLFGILPEGNYPKESGVLQWCFENAQIAGRNTTTMPSATGLYIPLIAASGAVGVLSAVPVDIEREFSNEEISSLQTCANLLASALERTHITEMIEKAHVEAEGEKLRTILLSSVSHDLRTPLASITGASSTIEANASTLPIETIRDLGRSINKEAERLSHLVTNLLEVTRLESGSVHLHKEPYFIEELIGAVRTRLAPLLRNHGVATEMGDHLPLIAVDGVLVEQLLTNLLENAAFHTPASTTITISAKQEGADILVCIADNGPGIPKGQEKKIFDKFYTLSRTNQKGTGLGLAICAAIVKAHHGKMWVDNKTDGAAFFVTLPIAVKAEQEMPDVGQS